MKVCYHFLFLNSCQLLILCTSAVLLLIPNSDRLQQVEDYVRGYAASTKYWPPSTSWGLCQRLCCFYQILTAFNSLRTMSEVVLLLPNTDHLQQVEDYVRDYAASTKYWPPSTAWGLCQRLCCFYQILTAFNQLRIMSEVILLLPNTDCLLQIEDYVKGCSTSTKYGPPSTSWILCQIIWSRHCLDASTAFLSGQCVYIWVKVEIHKIIWVGMAYREDISIWN